LQSRQHAVPARLRVSPWLALPCSSCLPDIHLVSIFPARAHSSHDKDPGRNAAAELRFLTGQFVVRQVRTPHLF
jgi:hypothetical protein